MASPAGTLELLARELATALRSLQDRLGEDGAADLLGELGLLLPDGMAGHAALAGAITDSIGAAGDLAPLLADLDTAIAGGDAVAIGLAGAAVSSQIVTVVDRIDDLGPALAEASTGFGGLTPAERATISSFASGLPRRLLDHLILEYLHERVPDVLAAVDVVGLVDRTSVDGVVGDELQVPHLRQALHIERFADLVSDPPRYARDLYDWGAPTFDGADLLAKLHSYITDGLQRAAVLLTPPTGSPVLEAYVFSLLADDAVIPPVLEGSLRFPATQDYERTYELGGPWRLVVTAKARFGADVGFRVAPPFDATLTSPSGTIELSFVAGLSASSESDPLLLIGKAGGTRLEATRIAAALGFSVAADLGGDGGEPTATAEVRGGRLVIDLGEGDGFIQSILGGAGVDAPFEVSGAWRPSTGLVIDAGAGIELAFPTNVELGPATVNALFVELGFTAGVPLRLGLAAAFTTSLGPLTATVDGIGTTLEGTLPADRRGNLGPVDLAVRFKPPKGLGLAVDGGGFKGGGFLRFDPDNERYAGVLELEFQDIISVKAIGLLTTRLPGGEQGFSLLILISVEFTPIQLGFGFTLNGVGGLLGLNRTVRVERLTAGIRDNTLESILFPTDVVANASRIVSDLRAIYPPAADRFVFGPMAKLGWGTPTLITVSLGLIVEVPNPVRIFIPGTIKAVVPHEELDLLKLQVNFVGGVDFEQQKLFFDASIYDSRLLSFPLTGDMAFRLSWGTDPNFLLTVGGFHPAYQPPPAALPELRRLTVQLLSGTNPRLTLETYFAVTSNTVQLGARIGLYAGAGSFNVYGFLAFDALFQFDPFRFVAEVKAMLALRSGSSSIASISLSLTLEGPTPWKADGTAKLKLFWFLTVKVRFSKTFGEERDTRLDDIAVLPLVEAALGADDNWRAEMPPRSHLLVTLASIEAAPGTIVAHPFGVLTVSQKVVPLGVRIDRFGHRRPSDAREFSITGVVAGDDPLGTTAVEEYFAPAQFFDRSDAEKLSSKSFERYPSGIRIAESEQLDSDHYAVRDVDFELSYIDSQRDIDLGPFVFRPDLVAFDTWAVTGAVAGSPLSFAVNRPSALAPDGATMAAEAYHVVGVDDLAPFDGVSAAPSEGQAVARMTALLAERPGLRGRIQVVPAHEAVV